MPFERMHCANVTACAATDPEPLGLGEEPHAASAMEQTASAARRRASGRRPRFIALLVISRLSLPRGRQKLAGGMIAFALSAILACTKEPRDGAAPTVLVGLGLLALQVQDQATARPTVTGNTSTAHDTGLRAGE